MESGQLAVGGEEGTGEESRGVEGRVEIVTYVQCVCVRFHGSAARWACALEGMVLGFKGC